MQPGECSLRVCTEVHRRLFNNFIYTREPCVDSPNTARRTSQISPRVARFLTASSMGYIRLSVPCAAFLSSARAA